MIPSYILSLFLILSSLVYMMPSLAKSQSAPAPTLFSETFGDRHHPAILLNAGAGNQSITWPDVFCQKLSEKGYFVIRYDYRDTGLSSAIDYDTHPYTVMDLAQDSLRILKQYHIKKAHFVGYSMGGELAQLVGAYYPRYAKSIILLATSTDFQPGFNAFAGKFSTQGLSAPHPDYVKWATRSVDSSQQTFDQKVQDYVITWKMLDGSPKNFAEDFFKTQGRLSYTRTRLQQPYLNHAKAMKATFALHHAAPALIRIPTLIIQGAKDPIFSPDHGRDLAHKIQHSKLIVWDDFAHAISPQNFDRIIDTMDQFIRETRT